MAVSPQSVRSIEEGMSALSLRYFGARARHPEFEFHGSHLFQGRGECRDLTPAQRVSLYREIVSLIGRNQGRLFVRGIDKAEHAERAKERSYQPEHPHKLAFRYLIERIDEWLEARQPEGKSLEEGSSPVFGLIVADEQKEVDREIIQSFAFWRDHGTGPGYRARGIHYLLDTVHYVRSQDSWLIQLVDCLAFLRNRYARIIRESGCREETWSRSEKTVVRLWRENCQPHVETERVWP
ncbi:MAG: DUF3800 domain-containing protein [Gemmatimonadota bacterium]|jgi:hypothetical protein